MNLSTAGETAIFMFGRTLRALNAALGFPHCTNRFPMSPCLTNSFMRLSVCWMRSGWAGPGNRGWLETICWRCYAMQRHRYQYVDRVIDVAILLGELADEVVFVGGSATGLLITDPAIRNIRPTMDVDVIVEIASRREYYQLADRLREKGFQEPLDGRVICRWVHGDLILDVMPTNEEILGFANRWYAAAVQHSEENKVNGVALRVVSPPYFLGTKLEAFRGRGENDYMLSHDMEDIVAILDGRMEIVDDVRMADAAIRKFISEQFGELVADRDFQDALPGHLEGDAASQRRLPIILDRMTAIVNLE